MSKAQRAKIVVEAMQARFPQNLADGKWDNTGLLVDAISPATKTAEVKPCKPKVLLTVDLTEGVCDEAIRRNSDIIIAYHPFIFSGIKAISSQNPQHRSLLRLVQNGISVYCPHTAVDAIKNGVNDWLADGLTDLDANEHSRQCVEPVDPPVPGHVGAGYGRLVVFKKPLKLTELVSKTKSYLGLQTVQLVRAKRHEQDEIRSVALCAGSGGSVLKNVKADMWLTGELGHHDMLHLRESGTSAIVCGHSNTERGYLPILGEFLAMQLHMSGTPSELSIAETDSDPIEYV